MTALELLTTLKELVQESDNYLNSCPNDIADFVIGNQYSNAKGMMLDRMIEFEFMNSAELVFEWLYDELSPLYKETPKNFLKLLDDDWHSWNSKYEAA
jgi:hypothetical protein